MIYQFIFAEKNGMAIPSALRAAASLKEAFFTCQM